MSLRFSLQPAVCFWVTCHFETGASKDPQMTLSAIRSKVPHIHVTTTHEPQISLYGLCFPLRPTVSNNVVTCHLETSASKDPKITLNTKRSKGPNVHVTTTTDSHISPTFRSTMLRLAISEVLAIFYFPIGHNIRLQSSFVYKSLNSVQVYWMTPKWHWTPKGQRHPIYIWQLPSSPRFISLQYAVQPTVFVLQAILRQVDRRPQSVTTTPRVPHFTLCRSTMIRLTLVEILAIFDFPIDSMLNYNCFYKSIKLKFQNSQKAFFVDCYREHSEIKAWSKKPINTIGGVVFWNFHSHGNENFNLFLKF